MRRIFLLRVLNVPAPQSMDKVLRASPAAHGQSATAAAAQDLARVYHGMKKRMRRDRDATLAPFRHASQPPPPPPAAVPQEAVEPGAAAAARPRPPDDDELRGIHEALRGGGLLDPPPPDSGDPRGRTAMFEAMLRRLEARGEVLREAEADPAAAFPRPQSPEEMLAYMRSMIEHHREHVLYEKRLGRADALRTIVAYSGGVILASLASYWAFMRLSDVSIDKDSPVNSFLKISGVRFGIDLLVVSAKVFRAGLDPNMTTKQKLKTAMAGMLKLEAHVTNFGLEVGVRYLLGAVMVTPLGNFAGMALITVLVGANMTFHEVAIGHMLFDKNVFLEVVAQHIMTDEELRLDHIKNVANAEAEKRRGIFSKTLECVALKSRKDSYAVMAAAAVSFQVLNPVWRTWLDPLADWVLINYILFPFLMNKLCEIAASERLRQILARGASPVVRKIREATKKWKRWNRFAKAMASASRVMHLEKIMSAMAYGIASSYLRTFMRTAQMRDGISAMYERAWGRALPPYKTDAELLTAAIPAATMEISDRIQALDDRAAAIRGELDAMGGGPGDIDRGRDLSRDMAAIADERAKLRDHLVRERDIPTITRAIVDGRPSTRTFAAYMEQLRGVSRRHADALYALAAQRLWYMTEARFDEIRTGPTAPSDLAAMSAVMGKADFETLSWETVAAWRRAERASPVGKLRYAKLSPHEGPAAALLEALARDLVTAQTSLQAAIVAEVEIVRKGFLTLDQLREMREPWPARIVEDLYTSRELDLDPDGRYIRNIGYMRDLLRLADPAISWEDIDPASEDGGRMLDTLALSLATSAEGMLRKKADVTREIYEDWKRNGATPDQIATWTDAVGRLDRLAGLGDRVRDLWEKSAAAGSGAASAPAAAPATGPRGVSIPAIDLSMQPGAPAASGGLGGGGGGGMMMGQQPPGTAMQPPSVGAVVAGNMVNPEVTRTVNLGLERGTRMAVQNIAAMALGVGQAMGRSIDIMVSLFFGGLSAMSQLVGAMNFPGDAGAVPPHGEMLPGLAPPGSLKDLASPPGLLECLHGERYTLGRNPDPPLDLVPFLRGAVANKNCFVQPYARTISQIANRGIKSVAESLTSGAVGWLGGPVRLAFGAVELAHSAVATAKIQTASSIIQRTGVANPAQDISILTGEARDKAVLMHMANVELHEWCGSVAVKLQDYTGQFSPCRDLAMFVDVRDLVAQGNVMLRLSREMMGSAVETADELRSAEDRLDTAGAMIKLMGKGSMMGAKFMTSKDPEVARLWELMTYGSEGVSTVLPSVRQLAKLTPEERARYDAMYTEETKNEMGSFTQGVVDSGMAAVRHVVSNPRAAAGQAAAGVISAAGAVYDTTRSAYASLSEGIPYYYRKIWLRR
jgi:hypothetical protein